jgi:tripartite-type tricarboxylate transporter receptor subunit TctC
MTMLRIFLACIGVALALAAQAQPFPSKPIRIVLAYAAGGPTDFLARTVGEKVSARLGQPVLVEARPGANERIATEHLLRSPADGYTVLLVAPPHATNPALFQMNYDAQKEITGLIHLINIPPLITTHPSSGLQNFGDLVKAAKAKPGELTYGTPGNATSNHLLMELLGLLADIKMQHIPFKGDSPAVTELLGGRITVSLNTVTAGITHVKAGRLRALGIASRERSPLLPEVPTLYEQGYPEAVVTTWFGLVIHAQTPRDIVNRLNAEFDAALQMPDVREKIGAVGMVPVGGPAEQFTAHIRAEAERWGRVVKTRGIKAE